MTLSSAGEGAVVVVLGDDLAVFYQLYLQRAGLVAFQLSLSGLGINRADQ